jgi:hypothetical protein
VEYADKVKNQLAGLEGIEKIITASVGGKTKLIGD